MAALVDAGLSHVQISFQGVMAEAADRVAGFSGALDKKRQAARLVREAGLPLTFNAVMHRQNLDQLPAMIDLAVELDAARIEVAHVQYMGWGLKNRAALDEGSKRSSPLATHRCQPPLRPLPSLRCSRCQRHLSRRRLQNRSHHLWSRHLPQRRPQNHAPRSGRSPSH
jgi:molybdenum cofactor biosynthesis enzyme MoaA